MTLPKRVKDITNQVFGSLTAIGFSHVCNRMAHWKYKCVCGNEVILRANSVSYEAKKYTNSQFPSCGCKDKEQKTKHGYRSASNTHPLYMVYMGIMNRCYNPNTPNYAAYGGKGVTICDEWKNNPQAFIDWGLANGWKQGLTIDKDLICIQKNITPRVYSPDTCQFLSRSVNSGTSSKRSNYGNHPNIKLSQEEVDEILRLYFSGEETNQSELARMYGLKSPSSIGRLIRKAKGLE